ncbi:hypothetical protein [Roseivirga thermotolerans]|uniref:Uncharacterized protein n=1 Tax=Roseivirga thermotolerans TaxID=1758176 RepID=A0ABQ3I8N1_9BACT|nr:hypothetical protein [Roseivirga thermotolerans]GHE64990.1 hypothetical protein GCM10011340_20010 [Roseivirga thermotolerans]
MKAKINFIIIVVLLAVSIVFGRATYHLGNRLESQTSIISEKNAQIDSIQLKNGTLAYEKLTAVADRKSLEEGYSFLKDSLKQMGVKIKTLQNAVFLARQTSNSGSGQIDTVRIVQTLPESVDTVLISRQLNINERFFSFRADLFPDDSFDYRYTFTDSLSILNTATRRNWFAPMEYKVRVVSANHRTNLTGATSLTVREKGTRWSLGAFGGYGWNGQKFTSIVGIGITREIIAF